MKIDDANPEEKAQLAKIYVYRKKLDKAKTKELPVLALNEMDARQPALQNMVHFLYLSKKFTMPQMMDITRMVILMWWFYREKSTSETTKIADALYVEKRKLHEAFLHRLKGNSPERQSQLVLEQMKTLSGQLLYRHFLAMLYEEKNTLATLSAEDKSYLMSHYKIMMD